MDWKPPDVSDHDDDGMVVMINDDDDDGDGDGDGDDDDDDDWQPKFRWEAALPHLLKKFFKQVRIFKQK